MADLQPAEVNGFSDDNGDAFPASLSLPSLPGSLAFVGEGITDMTIETIHIKFTKIGVYMDPSISSHLTKWKGTPPKQLGKSFFADFFHAPSTKLVRVAIIKGIKGSSYGSSLETSIRDKLALEDKFEEEEENCLEGLVEFFQDKQLETRSSVTYVWLPDSTMEIIVFEPGSGESSSHVIRNENVSFAIMDWLLGEDSISPSTLSSFLQGVSSFI